MSLSEDSGMIPPHLPQGPAAHGGAGAARLLWPFIFGGALALCGCGSPGFIRYAVAEAAASMGEARIAMDECRADLAAARDREVDMQWKAYIADQADTFAKAAKEKPTPEALKTALISLAEKFRTERLVLVEQNRQRQDERLRRAEQHFAFVGQILAKLDGLARREESVQAQLQHYQDLAEQTARQRFGLPPAPGLSESTIPNLSTEPAPVALPLSVPREGGNGSPPAP